jgi:hypothetical protein
VADLHKIALERTRKMPPRVQDARAFWAEVPEGRREAEARARRWADSVHEDRLGSQRRKAGRAKRNGESQP